MSCAVSPFSNFIIILRHDYPPFYFSEFRPPPPKKTGYHEKNEFLIKKLLKGYIPKITLL